MKMTQQERINSQYIKKLEGLIAAAEEQLEAKDKKDKAGIKFLKDRVSALNSQLSRLQALSDKEQDTVPQSGKSGGKKKEDK